MEFNTRGYRIKLLLDIELKLKKLKENINNKLFKFEGEYYNGKKWNWKIHEIKVNATCEIKNGSGFIKQYKNSFQLEFEGELLYVYKRKGKQYIEGRLEYEGEYLYNKKWNGKGYNKNGNIIYELNKRNGKVREYKYDKIRFEGE